MYVKSISARYVKGFKDRDGFTIDFTRPDSSFAGWTVVAGRNGTGKSSLLRMIALALVGPSVARSLSSQFAGWISQGEREAFVEVAFTSGPRDALGSGGAPAKRQPYAGLTWSLTDDGPEPVLEERRHSNAPRDAARRGPWSENPKGWFVAGYGPFRRLSGSASEAQRNMLGRRTSAVVTLFDESAALTESTWWLQEMYPRYLEGDFAARELWASIFSFLGDGLLPEGFRVVGYTSRGLEVERDGEAFVLDELSDGYRVVTALVLDIVRRMYASFGTFSLTEIDGVMACAEEGVVLIDEVDVHLHLSWQQEIGFWLRRHFPRVQFIVSTHSPFIAQAASPNGLIRLPDRNDPRGAPTHVDEETFNEVVNGTVDRSVVSDLFGLSSTFSLETRRLRERLKRIEVLIESGEADPVDLLEERDTLRSELAVGPSFDVSIALARLGMSLDSDA